jgi:hypothetical protein
MTIRLSAPAAASCKIGAMLLPSLFMLHAQEPIRITRQRERRSGHRQNAERPDSAPASSPSAPGCVESDSSSYDCARLPSVSLSPLLEEDVGGDPLLKAVVGSRLGTQLGLFEGVPLSAGAQNIKDRVSAAAIGRAWSAAAKAIDIGMHRQKRLQDPPERSRDAKAGGGLVIGRTRTGALGCLLFTHTR